MSVLTNVFNILILAINVAIPVVGVFLISTRTAGRARSLGMIGCVVTAAVALLQTGWVYVAPQLIRSSGRSIALIYGVVGAVFSIVSAVGLALIIAAVVAGRGGSATPPPAGPPNPYQPYPPQQPGAGYPQR